MTLQASGSITSTDIRNEIRQVGGNLVFPDITTRWLTEKPAGSIVLPTDLYGKRGVKNEDTVSVISGGSNPLAALADIGADYPNRMVVACLCAIGSGGSILQTTNISLGGIAMTKASGWAHFDGSIATSQGIAYGAGPVGQSTASFAVSFNRPATNLFARIYSFPNIGAVINQNEHGSTSASVSANIDIGSNAIAFINAVKLNSFGVNFTFTGATEEFDSDIGGNVHHGVAVINRLPTQVNRTMSCTSTGGAQLMSIASISFGD